MPRTRRRIQDKRPPCDCADCQGAARSGGAPRAAPDLATASARQEPPPASLLIFLDGALVPEAGGAEVDARGAGNALDSCAGREMPATGVDDAQIPHLHAVARWGTSGLLALRNPLGASAASDPAERERCVGTARDARDSGAHPHPLLGLANVLSYVDELGLWAAGGAESGGSMGAWTPVGERFRGFKTMTAAICSNVPAAVAFAGRAGIAHARCFDDGVVGGGQDPGAGTGGPGEWPGGALGLPEPDACAGSVLQTLGLASGRDFLAAGGTGMFDGGEAYRHLFLHASSREGDAGDAEALLQWADDLVRALWRVPGAQERILLSVVLTPPRGARCGFLPREPAPARLARLPAFWRDRKIPFPKQSFEMLNEKPVTGLVESQVALVAQRLLGSIRVDEIERLGMREAHGRGGGGCILAERLMHEIAYKIGCAYKYGA